MGVWYIRVRAKRRKQLDPDLLIQAVIALSKQLTEEARQQEAAEQQNDSEAAS